MEKGSENLPAQLTAKVSPKPPAGLPVWMLLTLVLTLTFAAYIASLNFQFVHDDRGQIVENPAVHSWAYVRQYFTAHVWAHIDPHQTGNYYRPLFLLWLRVNDMLFDARPWWWHLTTVLTHLAVTLLVYLLAARILRDRSAALVAALVFGLHPVHVEAVAWVSGVTEPLLGVLFLSSFLCYLHSRERQAATRSWLGLSLLLFALALLEKETAMVLPALVFAHEWIFGEEGEGSSSWQIQVRRFRYALWSAAPFLALLPFYLLARTMALKGFSPVITPLPLLTVVCTWPSLGWFWIRHLIWPVGLSPSYDFAPTMHPGWGNFVLPALTVLAVALGLIWAGRRSRQVAFASAWLMVPLLPLLEIRAFVEGDFAHDRYLYLPSVGFAMLVALAWRCVPAGRAKLLGLPVARTAPVVVLALVMGFDTVYQSAWYAGDETFYEHSARVAPNNKIAKNNLARWLCDQGRYDAALAIFQELSRNYPNFWIAAHNLGYTYYRLGRLSDAEYYFTRAIQIDAGRSESYLYLGLTRFRMNKAAETEAAIRQAIQIRPDAYGYHFALGIVLRSRGDLKNALAEFRTELARYPTEQAAHQQVAEIEQRLQQEEGLP